MIFEILLFVAAALAGAIGSVSGFGIGSILTPLIGARIDTKLAVAVVSIPHLIGTALRFWKLRKQIDRTLLLNFGVTSALGGLAGALLQLYVSGSSLNIVLGALLVFAGTMGVTGLADRMRFRGTMARLAGLLSGILGGLVGNQGGIRSAAMLGSPISKESFVATATAIALAVDSARMPVYFIAERSRLGSMAPLIALATVGVVLGTLWGNRLLRWIPETRYRKIVSSLILALGVFVLLRA